MELIIISFIKYTISQNMGIILVLIGAMFGMCIPICNVNDDLYFCRVWQISYVDERMKPMRMRKFVCIASKLFCTTLD